MSDIHEILVAVDFSEGSKAALDRAALIARQTGANLHVLHVWQAPEFVPALDRSTDATLASISKLVEARAREEMDRFVTEAGVRGITIRHAFVEAGVPATAIVDAAARQKHDLIVVGTHGRTGLAHALIGIVAERVVRKAPCPVLSVRERAPKASLALRRILAPVDYSDGSRRSLEYAASLALTFGAEIDVVHVWDRPAYVSGEVMVHGPGDTKRSLGELVHDNAERDMKEFLATLAPIRHMPFRLLSGEPASTLIKELEAEKYDLVVVGTHGRTGFRRFLLGSIAEKLVRYSPAPVLTVPSPH
jgi:nucleotide-binding universal stress UspA family protein